MVKLVSVGVLFLASLALVMAVFAFAQPAIVARHAALATVGAASFAAFTTYVLATHWAAFRRFTDDPWHFR